MNVEYINNNGYIVETTRAVYVFDYVEGMLPAHYLRNTKPLIFLVTTNHPEHFSQAIFSYDKTVIFPWDMGFAPYRKVFMMEPYEMVHLGFAKLHSFASCKEGVSYVIEEEDCKIFYAGTLNCWQDREKKGTHNALDARDAFVKSMKPIIQKAPFDLMMFPVNASVGSDYDEGARYAIVSCAPKRFFPTQFKSRDRILNFTNWTQTLPETKFFTPGYDNNVYREV